MALMETTYTNSRCPERRCPTNQPHTILPFSRSFGQPGLQSLEPNTDAQSPGTPARRDLDGRCKSVILFPTLVGHLLPVSFEDHVRSVDHSGFYRDERVGDLECRTGDPRLLAVGAAEGSDVLGSNLLEQHTAGKWRHHRGELGGEVRRRSRQRETLHDLLLGAPEGRHDRSAPDVDCVGGTQVRLGLGLRRCSLESTDSTTQECGRL